MEITKYETNYKKKKYLDKKVDISFKEDIKDEENKLINVYPDIKFQGFIGFGRSPYSVLPVLIYLTVQKMLKKKFLMNTF